MKPAIEQQQSHQMQRTISLTNNQVDSKRLFEFSNELAIMHNQERYTLRLTKNGKLILTK